MILSLAAGNEPKDWLPLEMVASAGMIQANGLKSGIWGDVSESVAAEMEGSSGIEEGIAPNAAAGEGGERKRGREGRVYAGRGSITPIHACSGGLCTC